MNWSGGSDKFIDRPEFCHIRATAKATEDETLSLSLSQ